MDNIGKIVLTLAISAAIIFILPASPVQDMLQNVSNVPFLPQICWFIPVHQCYAVSVLWLTCIGIYYTVSWILNQLQITQG